MPKPITVLNLFPSRAERLPTDPPFNPAWPPKNWADPNPKVAFRDQNGVPCAVYHVLANYDPVANKPVFEDVVMQVPLAKITNIVPSEKGSTWGQLLPDAPTPVRELEEDEVIKPGIMGVLQVFTAAELVVPRDPGQDFTAEEKELLLSAARHELARP